MASRQVPLARESSAEVVYTTWACIVEDDSSTRQMDNRRLRDETSSFRD